MEKTIKISRRDSSIILYVIIGFINFFLVGSFLIYGNIKGYFTNQNISSFCIIAIVVLISCVLFLDIFLIWKNESIEFFEDKIIYNSKFNKSYTYSWDDIRGVSYKSSGRINNAFIQIKFDRKVEISYESKNFKELEKLLEEKKYLDDIQTKVLKATSKSNGCNWK